MEWNRIRKPPGGDTNDIFQLEERQRFQRSENLSKKVIDNEKEKSGVSIPSEPVQSFERVRKPPGGDTNDIFGMERRQKSDALKLLSQEHQINEKKKELEKSSTEPEVSGPPSNEPSELNKENLTHLRLVTSAELETLGEEEPKLKLKLAKEVDEEIKPEPRKYFRHNTITGEVSEMDFPIRPQLKDCSNVAEQDEPPVHRSSIRVRQPPGGTSNIFF